MSWDKFWNGISDWFTSAGVNLLKAILALVIGIILVKIVIKILNRALYRTKLEKVAIRFIVAVIKFVLYLMIAYVIATMLGVPMTGFVAITTAASLAISLALQGSISNLANGVILISTKPFKENDFVEIAGQSGSVKEIKMLYTVLNTSDNKVVIVPNKNVVENTIINYSTNDTRKITWTFDVAYASDVEKVKAIINSIIINHEKILLEPTPFIALSTLSANGIKFTASCWSKSEDYWTVYYEIMDAVFNEFKRENISIPYNQLEIKIKEEKEVLPFREDRITHNLEAKQQKLAEEKAKLAEKDSNIEIFPGIVIKKKKKNNKNKKPTTTKETTLNKEEK